VTREEIEAIERLARGMREVVFWRGAATQAEIEAWAAALEHLVAPYYPEAT
jgi:hypothetical protein